MMKVVLNLISREPGQSENTILEPILEYFKNHPADQVTIITRERLSVAEEPNIRYLQLNPPHNLIAYTTWKRLKLERTVRELKGDRYLTSEQLHTVERQVLILPSVTTDSFNSKSYHFKSFKRILKHDASAPLQIIVFSELEKNVITKPFPGLAQKIKVVYRIPLDKAISLSYDEREKIKNAYAEGNEFFFIPQALSAERLTPILKGYSGFKKWQKSSMGLLICVNSENEATVSKLIEHYRFRDSLRLIPANEKEFAKIFSASYAVLLPEISENNLNPVIHALQAEVSLLISDSSVYSEVTGDAAFRFDAENKDSVTRTLLQVFREEDLRSRKILIGREVLKHFSSYHTGNKIIEWVKE